MDGLPGYLVLAVLIGTGATAFMDAVGLLRLRVFGTPMPDYAPVGRWVGHMPRGQFAHAAIARALPVPGERAIGWTVHYVVGVAFAALLLAAFGVDWASQPTIGPALAVGIGTVAVPFLVMQPAMGAGIAASRTPNPAAARMRSLVNHGIFGVGLFVAGWTLKLLTS